MITIEKTFPGTIAYPLERLGDPEKLVFFDIETTGSPLTTTRCISSAVSGRKEISSALSSGLPTQKLPRPMSSMHFLNF